MILKVVNTWQSYMKTNIAFKRVQHLLHTMFLMSYIIFDKCKCTIAIMINKPDTMKPFLFLICRERYIVFVQQHSSSTGAIYDIVRQKRSGMALFLIFTHPSAKGSQEMS